MCLVNMDGKEAHRSQASSLKARLYAPGTRRGRGPLVKRRVKRQDASDAQTGRTALQPRPPTSKPHTDKFGRRVSGQPKSNNSKQVSGIATRNVVEHEASAAGKKAVPVAFSGIWNKTAK